MGQEIILRHPNKKDGLAVYKLIKSSPPLDVNSCYYYYMMCRDFRDTSAVAEQNGKIIGFISAYRRPANVQRLFVWQVAVSKEARGRGLSKRMLFWLVRRPLLQGLREIETTISPSNGISQALFHALKRELGTGIRKESFLSGDDLGGEDIHEAEELYRITLNK